MGSTNDRIEWTGGQLSELISVLSGAALPSRIEVFAPDSNTPAGEVHLLAGGLNDAMAGDLRGQDAVAVLQKLAKARFVVETRLPDPESGSLTKPGPADGNLAERPVVELMRYCEEYVLTCTVEVWRGEEQARLSYRRGELVSTLVGGSDDPDRLPEVLAWKEGFYELALPPPATPPVPAPSKRNTAGAAVVGVTVPSAPTSRPLSGERPKQQGTDPLISVDAIKRKTPTRSTPVRAPDPSPTPRMPPGPPMPGLRDRIPTPHSQPAVAAAQPAVGARPAAPAAAPAPARVSAAPASAAPVAPVNKPAPPRPAPPRPGQADDDQITPRPSSRMAEPPQATPPRAAAGAPRHSTPAQGFEINPPPPSARAPVPAQATKAPAPAAERPAVVPPAETVDPGARPARTRPAKPRPPGPPAIRGAGAATADKPANVFNSTSGEIRRQNTPVRGIDSYSASVEVAREVQDPAAFVNTPEPLPPSRLVDEATTRLPPIQAAQPNQAAQPADPGARSSDRLSAYTSVQKNDFGGDTDRTTAHLGKRRTGRGIGRWPLVVYIVLGVVLGIGAVVAYSVFHGLPLSP